LFLFESEAIMYGALSACAFGPASASASAWATSMPAMNAAAASAAAAVVASSMTIGTPAADELAARIADVDLEGASTENEAAEGTDGRPLPSGAAFTAETPAGGAAPALLLPARSYCFFSRRRWFRLRVCAVPWPGGVNGPSGAGLYYRREGSQVGS
jgi:hypothetical protein